MNLEERNPYFKSRLIQEDVCKKACDDNFSVAVLELPYIFGTQPGLSLIHIFQRRSYILTIRQI